MFVHQIQQRLAGPKTAQVFEKTLHGQMNEILHVIRSVRR